MTRAKWLGAREADEDAARAGERFFHQADLFATDGRSVSDFSPEYAHHQALRIHGQVCCKFVQPHSRPSRDLEEPQAR